MEKLSKKQRISKIEEAIKQALNVVEDGDEETMMVLRSELVALLEPKGLPTDLISLALDTVDKLDPKKQREKRLKTVLRECPFCQSPNFFLIQEAVIDRIKVNELSGHFKVDLVICEGCGRVELFTRELHEFQGDYHLFSDITKRLQIRKSSPYR